MTANIRRAARLLGLRIGTPCTLFFGLTPDFASDKAVDSATPPSRCYDTERGSTGLQSAL